MRWPAVALAVGAGLGCGGAEPERALCTATSGPVRSATILAGATGGDDATTGRGLPSASWSWDLRGLSSHATYAYDTAGRLVEQQDDVRATAEDEPDGFADAVTAIAYAGATAEVTAEDRRTGTASRVATYEFDDAGRPVRFAREVGAVEVRTFHYDEAGRVRSADVRLGGPSPGELHLEYAYGADGWPASIRSTAGGVTDEWLFRYEQAPGRVEVTPLFNGRPGTPHAYEHDAAGRLVRVRLDFYTDRDLDIAYADDGAVAVLRGEGTLHTYSAECGVAFEVPRGPRGPRGPEPAGHYELPEIPTPFPAPP